MTSTFDKSYLYKIIISSILIFIFAFSLRMWNLNMMGRWWDEEWYVEKGVAMIELIKRGDFHHPFWYRDGSDHPPLTSYFYGLAAYKDMISYEPNGIGGYKGMPPGLAVFNYDLANTRLVSIFVSSVSIVFVFLFGVRYFSFFVGVTSAMVLAMLPHFLGLSQLVVLESWIVLLFTACVFAYLLYLEKNRHSLIILTGILTGLNLLVKQSNILIFVFYILAFLTWRIIKKDNSVAWKHFLYLGITSLITCIILYPGAWLNIPGFFQFSYDLWFSDKGLLPEQIFGIRMGARSFFYIMATLVTTPVLILLLGLFGLKVSWTKRKSWIYVILIIWLLVPFLMSFFHHRQNMVRYIIQFYVPLSLLSAIGFEYLITRFTKSRILKYSLITPIFVYLMITLYSITPYYLNYYNELVGGTKNVYERELFFTGWFGEGLRGPGKYLEKTAPKNASVGMALNPEQTLYKVKSLRYETFDEKKRYDYVVVNNFNVVRIGFDKNKLDQYYKVVYTEKADGADLAWVYKRK